MTQPISDINLSRRTLLRRMGTGLGALGALHLLHDCGDMTYGAQANEASGNPLAARQPHFPAKAKHVIHLFMNGGPSHIDTFDPKPALAKHAGKNLPMENCAPSERRELHFRHPFPLAVTASAVWR